MREHEEEQAATLYEEYIVNRTNDLEDQMATNPDYDYSDREYDDWYDDARSEAAIEEERELALERYRNLGPEYWEDWMEEYVDD